MSLEKLIEEYRAGPAQLRAAIQGMTPEHLAAQPIPGKWSTQQLICHLSDFEPIYADRAKRILAEEVPLLLNGNPDLFAEKLAYDQRDVEEELQVIEATRAQMARILKTVSPEDFERAGRHSTEGLITLRDLMQRITRHIPHHLPFIAEKRRALGI